MSLKQGLFQFRNSLISEMLRQEIVFKKDKATLHVISKRCEDSKLFRRRSADVTLVY